MQSWLQAAPPFFLSCLVWWFFYFAGDFAYYGLKIEIRCTLLSMPIAFLASLPLTWTTSKMGGESAREYNPLGGDLKWGEYIILFLILAPLGEDCLFRGILLLSLLPYGAFVAITVPALLFSLVHLLPFKNTPCKFLVSILISSFALGLLAGYFRVISYSLLPAYLTHTIFNLSGRMTEK